MTVVCREWRSCDARDAVTLVAAEARRWRELLHWHVSESWRVIEPARIAGQLPGFIAYDTSGRAVGWTAFLPHEGHLQVMAVAAPDAGASATLVDAILASREAEAAASTIFCVRDGSPGLASALTDRGFAVDSYHYMSFDLRDAPPVGGAEISRPDFVPWRDDDAAVADLCARAYRDAGGVRAFAPGGTPAEWRGYVAGLIQGTGCGWFLPELSLVVPAQDRAEVTAAVVMTDLGIGTAHVAQIVVDPVMRGRGTGRALLTAALKNASGMYDRATLLVSSANTAALSLYRSLGFRNTAAFVVAGRPSGSVRVHARAGALEAD
jgi:ribosomal protein S18 acetylase RimI-like enzyme